MTPLAFEAEHGASWEELERLLDAAEEGEAGKPAQWDGARLADLYRATCEHLALAQARSYPVHVIHRLESITQRAHRLVYARRSTGAARWREFALVGIPQAVRRHRGYVAAAAALFVLPLLLIGWATWRDPGFVLHLVSAGQVQQFESMYGDGEGALGRQRSAETDWQMFAYYVMHNIGLGFQCFAGGIFAGVGSVFFLLFNGAFAGGLGGYLIAIGYGENFLSFVVTHGAFELTAIVLSGAAGLSIGHAWIAPGRRTRSAALRDKALEAVPIVVAVVAMLLIAAAVEAFWSSARWVPPLVKFVVGGLCWLLVLSYFGWQGRPAARKRHAD
jgi:uncharacterized membrane protein SpoIIM required for sporulation